MAISYKGLLCRALNPIWSKEALSGLHAAKLGGRFNPQGIPAPYTSLSPVVALREATQVGNPQPTTLVTYEAEIERVFDGRDLAELATEGMDATLLAARTRRDEMKRNGQARTQIFAWRLIGSGHHGLLVRSFAPGTSDDDLNLVLWVCGDAAPFRMRLIDDEGRLPR